MTNGPILSRDQQLQLIEPITRAEVQVALQDIDSQKAPGVMGIMESSSKKTWSIIGEEVSNEVIKLLPI
ncbi:hypothetical protein KY290_021727 [Solanum tuberosum]|uniref:Uncharacterized protein n=1 Tax=Solanum tuberosum TaxID=4113 RepID=A0ABQ7V2C7_SOLTU|nr:hypothetical protein KY289_020890 [Solanum tuberosum]KAH0758234.1 hypothetical protein KY290_021727 [Solanum tuberosum]